MEQLIEVRFIERPVVLRFKEIIKELNNIYIPEVLNGYRQEFLEAYNRYADQEVKILRTEKVISTDVDALRTYYFETVMKMKECLAAYNQISSVCKKYDEEVMTISLWKRDNYDRLIRQGGEAIPALELLKKIEHMHNVGLVDPEGVQMLWEIQ